jgi:hypothetical protein
MKASEIIKELQERIELYGDTEVSFRNGDGGGDPYNDTEILSVFFDGETECVIMSDLVDPF